jgi:hypothetical protein
MSDNPDPAEHDPGDLAAFAEGRLDEGRRARLVDHLAGCRQCRETLARLARGLRESASVRSTQWRWISVAAAMAIGVTAAAGVLVLRQPEAVVPATRPAPTADPAAPTPGAPPPQQREPSAISPRAPTVRGSGVRIVGRKHFRLVAGEWIDESYDPAGALPTVDIRSASERSRTLADVPALAPFFRLGSKVTVVLDGTVYRLDLGSL